MSSDLPSRIQDVLEDLSRFSSFGGCYFDFAGGRPPMADRGVCRFCDGCLKHSRAGQLCQNHVYSAAVQGFAIGDAWYTRCWLGVDCVVIPVAPDNQLIGAIEFGGFLSPGDGRDAEQEILSRLASLDSRSPLEHFVSALQGMREAPFLQVRAAAEFVLEATWAKGLNRAGEFRLRRRIFQMQQQVARTAAGGGAPAWDEYLAAITALAQLPDHAAETSKRELLDRLAAALFFLSGDSVEQFRGGLLPLLAFQTFRRLRQGGAWKNAAAGLDQELLELARLPSIPSLCEWIESRAGAGRDSGRKLPSEGTDASGPPPLLAKVEAWLEQHLGGGLRLTQAARAVGVSSSTLVHRLRRDHGTSFSRLATGVRVREAKRLLAFSRLSIGEISRKCGFRDQSYFTKIFTREIGLRPGEFRRMLMQQTLGAETAPQTR